MDEREEFRKWFGCLVGKQTGFFEEEVLRSSEALLWEKWKTLNTLHETINRMHGYFDEYSY